MTSPSETKFNQPSLLQIFPTFIWRALLQDTERKELNALLLQNLQQMDAPLSGLAPGENWQSEQNLHERPAFAPLAQAILAGADGLLEYLKVADRKVLITGCWANVNGVGTPHRLHSHRNNFLSGAYYMQLGPGADSINFYDPRPQTGIIRPHVTSLTPENTEMVVLKVEEGEILLFPSWLLHSVDPNRSTRPRISFSFNLMFPAFAETLGRPVWTSGKGHSG